MIDYDKLKIALEMAEQYSSKHQCMFDFTIAHDPQDNEGGFFILYWDYETKMKESFNTDNLDSIINKLQELTKPKLKYEIGQEVWFISIDNNIDYQKIDDTDSHSDECYFINEQRWFRENELYDSYKSLVEAQIDYWTSLKNEVMSTPFEGPIEGFKTPLATKHAHEEGDFVEIRPALCKHDCDVLNNNDDFKFIREVAGNRYYLSKMNHEIFCSCGSEADFPHQCKCKKCGEFYK